LFTICFGNELFFVALYLMKWVHTPLGYTLPIVGPLTWASALALACAPICALKNVINIVQLWKASKILVGVDLAERAMARRATIERLTAANSTAVSEKTAFHLQSISEARSG
jgi:CDP-diacylglycerol--inositol 3-phosphatidyltransferase